MRKIIITIASFFVVLQCAFGQAGEVVGTFLVTSVTGSDPNPVVTGTYNSTLGFNTGNVQVGDFLFVRQVIGNVHRRKVYEITAKVASNPTMTLTLDLYDGVSGGPFPTGVQVVTRMSQYGLVYDVPHPSQEMESYVMNYAMSHLEGEDVDTIIERNDSLFVTFRGNNRELYVGPASATAIDTSFQVGDSIYVTSAGDTIFTGIAYANDGIDTTVLISGTWYIITEAGDTLECGDEAQVVVDDAAPSNPATYLIHIDTLGTDTMWFNNDSIWVRFNVGGSSIGAPFFVALNQNLSSFHPTGVPPIGAIIFNPYQGSFMRKYGPGLIFDISEPNARIVPYTARHFEQDTMNLWDLSKRAAATVSMDAVDGYCYLPSNIDGLLRGGTRTVIVVNYAATPRVMSFASRYRKPNGTVPLDPLTIPESSEITLDFTLDQVDNEMILRLNSHPFSSSGTTYTFSDSANGLDLAESGGTVTVAPDVTELTYSAVVGADSIIIWDSSLNAHRRTSIAEVVALASAGTVTVTDQVNGLDIDLTGSDITISLNHGEVAHAPAASADSILIKDVSAGAVRRTSVGSIVSLATSSLPVTGVNDQNNGLDLVMNGTNVEASYDFDELPDDPTYNGTEVFIFKDIIDGLYKKASTSWLSGGYMDLLTNQSASGVKKFTTGLQYGSGTMPTGVPFGTANQVAVGIKGGGSAIAESNWANFNGLIIDHSVPSGIPATRLIATGVDSPSPLASYLEIYTRPAGSPADVVRDIRFASSGTVPLIFVGASTGAGGGLMNFSVGGVGFDGASSNYRLTGIGPSNGFGLYENGGVNMEVPPGQQAWVPFSDIRAKYDTVRVEPTAADIRQFKAYSYKLLATDSTAIGVIAQQIEALYPELVLRVGGGDTLGVNYNGIAALALAAATSLQEQVDAIRQDSVATEESSGTTVVFGTILPLNTSGSVSGLTVSLPPGTPSVGDWFGVSDSRSSAGTKNITIDFMSAGDKFHAATANDTIAVDKGYAEYRYVSATVGWVRTN